MLHARKLNVLKRVWYTIEFSDIYMYHLGIVYMVMHVTIVPTCTRKISEAEFSYMLHSNNF